MTGYYPGYSFAVAAPRIEDGESLGAAVYAEPWSDVHPRRVLGWFGDGAVVECIAYIDGALAVRCPLNHELAGWLG